MALLAQATYNLPKCPALVFKPVAQVLQEIAANYGHEPVLLGLCAGLLGSIPGGHVAMFSSDDTSGITESSGESQDLVVTLDEYVQHQVLAGPQVADLGERHNTVAIGEESYTVGSTDVLNLCMNGVYQCNVEAYFAIMGTELGGAPYFLFVAPEFQELRELLPFQG